MEQTQKGKVISSVVKGAGLSVIITLFAILVFALVLKFTSLNGVVVKSVNQFIKVLSIFLGSFFFIRGNLGLIKGALLGLIYMALTYLIFMILGSDISFNLSFIFDLIFSVVIGAISGVIAVNVKK